MSKPKKQYLYQLSIRRADDIRKQFSIESDSIISNRKFTKEDAEEIAQNFGADVLIVFLGELIPPKEKNLESFDIRHFSKEEIEEHTKKWNRSEEHVRTNDNNRKEVS